MNLVDTKFINNLEEIMKQEWEEGSRARWEDGTLAKTKRILQVVDKYDLSEGFPILSLRDINWKASIDEIIWIMFKQSNNVKDLNSSIWNSWADSEGNINKAYGYQIRKETMGYPSQLHYVIDQIKNNPKSRRIMMNMFSVDEQHEKGLVECAYATHFSVKDGKLHMTLVQRAGDFLPASGNGGFNTIQYAFLQHAIAQECGLEAGIFTHFVQDLHIYDKHLEQCELMLERGYSSINTAFTVPEIKIANKSIFELTVDDVEIINYNPLGKIGKIPVAV